MVYEVSTLKRLSHPNVIPIFGVSIDEQQTLYILTELCEQHSVKSFFSKFSGKIPLKVKLKILFDVVKALYHIHNHSPSLVHRDIKPENIFLTSDLKAKLGDFG